MDLTKDKREGEGDREATGLTRWNSLQGTESDDYFLKSEALIDWLLCYYFSWLSAFENEPQQQASKQQQKHRQQPQSARISMATMEGPSVSVRISNPPFLSLPYTTIWWLAHDVNPSQ